MTATYIVLGFAVGLAYRSTFLINFSRGITIFLYSLMYLGQRWLLMFKFINISYPMLQHYLFQYLGMCITFFALLPHGPNSQIDFVIAFNRDENVGRQTKEFGQFDEDPNIFAGQDMLSGGTWLGINKKTGIFVALTNFFYENPRVGVSRGKLMKRFLSSDTFPIQNKEQFIDKLRSQMQLILEDPYYYSPFNLVIYPIKMRKLFYLSSQKGLKQPLQLEAHKFYGLSNTQLFDIWPKIQYGVEMFKAVVDGISENDEANYMKIEEMMKNNKHFDKPWIQPSIFIDLYYSDFFKSERMTKSTFIGIFRNTGQNQISANIREITHPYKQSPKSIVDCKIVIEN